jgi:gliding motility-associated-like protein
VNGTWTFALIENTTTEIQFNKVELVFGPPFSYVDITGGNANAQCDQAQCVQSGAGEITLATNVNYPQNQPNYPNLTVNGCNWNAEPNNTSWFYFTASAATVDVSVSGFTNNAQQTIVLRNTGSCAAPAYSLAACPTSMFVGGCNTTTGDPVRYHRVCYDGGIKFNHGYSLSGLTVGEEYVLIVDGQSGANSTFYIEIASGADNGCAPLVVEPEITEVVLEDPGCDNTDGSITVTATGAEPLQYSIDNGQTFQANGSFTGLAAGDYTIVVLDDNGLSVDSLVTLVGPVLPVVESISTVDPSCGETNGSITIGATGAALQYSIDGGVTFQPSNTFADLAAGTYPVVVSSDGCTVALDVVLAPSNGPQITAVNGTDPTCNGDLNGSITIVASGPDPLQYSIDGGTTFQSAALFEGLAAGTYQVVVQDANGCPANSTAVLVDPAPLAWTNVEVSDESCSGVCDGIVLAEAQGGDSFSLNGGAPQSTGLFSGLCPATYQITLANAGGCSIDSTVTVAGGTVVVAGFTASPSVGILPGTTVVFTSTSQGASSVAWDFGGFGTSTDDPTSFVFPLEEGTATVCLVATSANACADTACTVLEFGADSEVIVPNVFSPNGDGDNDTFGIIGDPGPLSSFSLQVYNRWGQLVFSGDRLRMVWDGRQGSGMELSEGTYYWVLNYQPTTGELVERTGHVTLLR